MEQYITINNVKYGFAGIWRKKGKAPLYYLQNQIGLRFIVVDDARDNNGARIADGLAIYESVEDITTKKYKRWFDEFILPVIWEKSLEPGRV
jgi:hypothetical protein